MTSVRSITEGSGMDMPLAKAGPTRNSGNASVITYLRRIKEVVVQL